MLATFYPLIALLPNGKRFYAETAVHNAATGCLAAGYNEWYSIWDNTAQNGIDQEVIAHAGDAVQTAGLASRSWRRRWAWHIEDRARRPSMNWDAICDNQADPEFGKTLCLSLQKLVPPYYFIRNVPRALQEPAAALTVSDRMEVRRRRRQPHPRTCTPPAAPPEPRTSSPPPAPACCWAPPSPKTW